MSAVAARKNKQVWDAIENDNLKQALQLCTKRLKKGEKDDYLQALRGSILLRSSSTAQKDTGAAELSALVHKEPPVVDVESLLLIQDGIRSLQQQREPTPENIRGPDDAATLWERAIRARPQDEALPREWFGKAFDRQDWRAAQKAAMSLQRSFPQKREYYFWAILSAHLLESSPGIPPSDRKLFGTLAYRMISKAAADVPMDPHASSRPGRSIQTPQELHLLLLIYRRHGYVAEAMQILQSAHIGTHSSVAKGDWSFVRIHLDLLEEAGRWSDLWHACLALLRKAQEDPPTPDDVTHEPPSSPAYGDDWRVWKGLVVACTRLQEADVWDRTKRAISGWIGPDSSEETAVEALRELVEACKNYFDETSTKTCCFDDLRTYVERLDEPGQEEFVRHIDAIVNQAEADENVEESTRIMRTATRINHAKLIFLTRISQCRPEIYDEVLPRFIERCLKLYRISLPLGAGLVVTDNRPGDDASILAVMGLVYRYVSARNGGSSGSCHLLQASTLLEHVLSRSKQNYQALLMLVRIYRLTGAGSLASTVYPRLAIKQIQHDTLSHNMYTRISSVHPHPTTSLTPAIEQMDADPALGLTRAMGIYDSSAKQLPGLSRKALNEGSYDQVPGFLEFGRRVRDSVCKTMWKSERRRIDRLIGSSSNGRRAEPMDLPPAALTDNRDNDVMMRVERSSVPSFDEVIRLGPQPKASWVSAFAMVEEIYAETYTGHDENPGGNPRQKRDFAALARLLDDIVSQPGFSGESTDSERTYLRCQVHVAKTLDGVRGTPSGRGEAIERCIDSLEQWLQGKSSHTHGDHVEAMQVLALKSSPPSLNWEHLHEQFLCLDALKGILALLNFVTAGPKAMKDAISKERDLRLRSLVRDAHERIRSQTRQRRNLLSESGVVGQVVDAMLERREDGQGTIGSVLQELIGEAETERVASRFIESWLEALDGILRVKIDGDL
ncbi:MAG: hypothetical protein M1838_004456 [Thelocarpon superellum]|nr:MAG: hypothetical protein M1838_004456 [Thelocarpon superellum]